MKKADRQKIFEKFDGKCAYCGCELTGGWHVDHIEPVNRTQKRVPGYFVHKETKERCQTPPERWWMDYERVNDKYVFDKMLNPENDTVENSLPSCRSCNITKSNYNLDGFRKWIENTYNQLNQNNNANYKFGKRFGIIHETPKPVVFFFEVFIKE